MEIVAIAGVPAGEQAGVVLHAAFARVALAVFGAGRLVRPQRCACARNAVVDTVGGSTAHCAVRRCAATGLAVEAQSQPKAQGQTGNQQHRHNSKHDGQLAAAAAHTAVGRRRGLRHRVAAVGRKWQRGGGDGVTRHQPSRRRRLRHLGKRSRHALGLVPSRLTDAHRTGWASPIK